MHWLNVTACCGAQDAEVWTSGPFIHPSELASWMDACEKIYGSLAGEAKLDCMEPELKVRLNAEELGRISMSVKITPDHLEQKHTFRFEIDQSYLTGLIKDCRKILADFPIR